MAIVRISLYDAFIIFPNYMYTGCFANLKLCGDNGIILITKAKISDQQHIFMLKWRNRQRKRK